MPEFAAAAERLIRSGAVYFFQIRSVGGALADVDPAATAYGYRAANSTDDAPSIERFAAEVAPATRELVAAERARR